MPHRMTLEKDDIPLFFEAVRLRSVVEVAGWLAAVVLTALGIGLAVNADGWVLEAIGVVAAGSGGVAMIGLVRCRRFESVVDRRFVTGRAGPLVDRLPLGMVGGTAARAATSWRRLYSDREAVLRGPDRAQRVILPSRDPEALIDAIRSASAGAT